MDVLGPLADCYTLCTGILPGRIEFLSMKTVSETVKLTMVGSRCQAQIRKQTATPCVKHEVTVSAYQDSTIQHSSLQTKAS